MFCSRKHLKKVVPEGAFADGAPDINFKDAENIYVSKLSGEKVRLSSIYEGKKTVMIFLRKFDCPTCYTYAMLFAYLRPILDKSDIRIVFFTCHDDLSEVHIFIRNFAYYLRRISVDGLKPLPGELFLDPTREAYKFFGYHKTLSKTELQFLIYTLWWEKKLGLFRTDQRDGSKALKPMSEHHVFMEIMNYIRTRMPVFIKQSGFEPESLLWQSPGICVVHENKLLYRVGMMALP
jgi:hypothetical protein